MNYLNKYNKYSNKLIKFNNNSFKGGNIKRIKNEIKTLVENGYKDVELDEENLILKFKSIDNINYEVKFPKDYPFKPPTINGKILFSNVWSPALNILNLISYNKKVLIFCHFKDVHGSFEPLVLNNHWYGEYPSPEDSLFKQLFTKYKLSGKPLFETVDKVSALGYNHTYTEDGFSDKFIDNHIA